MNSLLVGLLTAAPVLLGSWLGSLRGGGRTLTWLSRWVFAWGGGIGLAAYGLRRGWHAPWGLMTPIVVGLLAAVLLRMLLAWRSKRSPRPVRLGFLQRSSGAALGAVMGFVLAVGGWQVALLANSLTTPLPVATIAHDRQLQPAQVGPAQVDAAQVDPAQIGAVPAGTTAWSSLAELAHRGFIQHLPVAGPMTEEMLAVATILKTPQPVRKEFAQHKQWDSLADSPSFQAMAQDQALFDDIDAAVAGNLVALYRLQRHPLIIAFYHEEQLQAIVAKMQVSQIAAELLEFQHARTAEPAF